ncbi:hypothetical protein [Chryseobacterium sp. RU33C]|uniref:helix-hairpin-helix domain-containing protein n=1 Tax=Chryseobacterium sp. TaxID=1871047 RepID=UPI000954816F|nr:hypothetical protein [Chryseobacterium sp. RU33C]SIR72576.1 Helix-hairpin-helix motif-containing protein [Chryseobacterium sp. RU33C]
MHIERLETKLAQLIPEEKNQNGEYTSLEDFIKRIPIGIETLQILIIIEAFRFTRKQKHELQIQAFLTIDPIHPVMIIFPTLTPEKNLQALNAITDTN